jgi:hypothetical protein
VRLTPRPAGGVFSGLDAEWASLCSDASVQAAVADWLMTDGLADEVAAVTDSWVRALGPRQLLAALRTGHGVVADDLADAVLRALLRRAAGDDRSAALAARIVVQAMIPAAVRMTRGQVRPFGGRSFDDVGHMVIAAVFEVARSGRIHARPGRAAANLTLDALGRVCRELAAEREERGEILPEDFDLTNPAPGPADHALARSLHTAAAAAGLNPGPATEEEAGGARLELLELVLDAMEAGALPARDARAITRFYATDPEPDEKAAAAAGVTTTAWRRRRCRAVDRLKHTALARPCAA